MKTTLIALMGLILAACAHLHLPQRQFDGPDAIRESEQLQRIQEVRDSGETARSCALTDDFLKTYPHSAYYLAARLQEGRCFEDAARWNEADAVYRSIREMASISDPGLPVLAEWRLSFVAEAKGDDFHALAHVLSAERNARDLPERVARIELPSRKAMLSFRLGHDDDGEKAFREAERGLREMLSSPRPKPGDSWLARLYLEMGRSQVTDVDAENLTRFLKAQQVSQPYLLKAMRYPDAAATSAYEILHSNYMKYWNALASMPADPAAGAAVASRLKREKQIPLLSEFLKIVHEAQAVRPPGDAMTPAEKEFYGTADIVAESIRRILYATAESTVLTEESRVLNALRRQPLRAGQPVSDPNL